MNYNLVLQMAQLAHHPIGVTYDRIKGEYVTRKWEELGRLNGYNYPTVELPNGKRIKISFEEAIAPIVADGVRLANQEVKRLFPYKRFVEDIMNGYYSNREDYLNNMYLEFRDYAEEVGIDIRDTVNYATAFFEYLYHRQKNIP